MGLGPSSQGASFSLDAQASATCNANKLEASSCQFIDSLAWSIQICCWSDREDRREENLQLTDLEPSSHEHSSSEASGTASLACHHLPLQQRSTP